MMYVEPKNVFGRRCYFGRGQMQGAYVDVQSQHREWLDKAERLIRGTGMSPQLRELLERIDAYFVDKSDTTRDPSGGYDDVPNEEMELSFAIRTVLGR